MAINLTEKAAREVKRLIDARGVEEKLYLRMSVMGGGRQGFQHKLDLDTDTNSDVDELFDFHGVQVVVDKQIHAAADEAASKSSMPHSMISMPLLAQ